MKEVIENLIDFIMLIAMLAMVFMIMPILFGFVMMLISAII